MSGKGKSVDLSTPWSEWAWDNRGYWYTSRFGPYGEPEYDYRHPDGASQSSTSPRYPGPSVTDAKDNSYYSQPHESALPPTSQYPTSPGYVANSHSSTNYTTAQPVGKIASEYTVAVSNYGGALATQLGALSVASGSSRQFPAPPEKQWQEGRFQPGVKGNSQRVAPAPLDSRYGQIPNHDPEKFWRVGRVFMTVWGEPAQKSKAFSMMAGQECKSQYSTGYLGTNIFSEVRRFVVIRPQHGSSICSPIHTYNDQATLKPNLPEVNQHTIIYTTKDPPAFHSITAEDGKFFKERLRKDPIKVDKAPNVEDLHRLSRLNYSKIYTVEHYVEVVDIGMVAKDCLASLKASCYLLSNLAPPEPPQRSASGPSRQQRDKKRSGKTY